MPTKMKNSGTLAWMKKGNSPFRAVPIVLDRDRKIKMAVIVPKIAPTANHFALYVVDR